MLETRIDRRFAKLKAEGRAGFITFLTAGDPDYDTSLEILNGLPAAGADVIELGMPFSDPMADGPAIQASSLRALKAGASMKTTLELVRAFRKGDDETPIVLMGYYNPVYQYGVPQFLNDSKAAGVDGLIIVDLPPEEDSELCVPAREAGVNFIRLATPTTDNRRLPAVLANSSGFVYYVSVTGITGAKSGALGDVAQAVARLRAGTQLPLAIGFGIRTGEQAAGIAKVADAAVVGSALVDALAEGLKTSPAAAISNVLAQAGTLAKAVRAART